MNIDREEFDDPVELPDGVHHCGPTAYNTYGCRCRYCVKWSRLSASVRHYKGQGERLKRRREVRDYLALRGIYIAGPGPFKRNPTMLATIVANHLGDDLEVWLSSKSRSGR